MPNFDYEILFQHSDVGNIQDVIATLEYDIQAVKKKIHMEEIQGTTLLSLIFGFYLIPVGFIQYS